MDQSESLIDAEEGSAAPPLLVIAVTGFKRRDFDKLALTSSGIEIRGDLDSDTKILVASEGSGLSQREDGLANKVQACKANCDIPIVNIEWVYASLSAGRPVEVEAYLATDEYLGMPRADPPSIAEDATSVEPAAAAAAAEEGEATEVRPSCNSIPIATPRRHHPLTPSCRFRWPRCPPLRSRSRATRSLPPRRPLAPVPLLRARRCDLSATSSRFCRPDPSSLLLALNR